MKLKIRTQLIMINETKSWFFKKSIKLITPGKIYKKKKKK